MDEFEAEGWREVVREPSQNNPAQKKTKVHVKEGECGDTYALCLSEERMAKDRAIREKHEARLLIDLEKLAKRVESGKLKERYPRVARYYTIGLRKAAKPDPEHLAIYEALGISPRMIKPVKTWSQDSDVI